MGKINAYIDHWKSWIASGQVFKDIPKCLYSWLKAYLLFIVIIVPLQRSFLYAPSAGWLSQPQAHGAETVHYKTIDGIELTSWYKPPRDGMPVIVMFHGNAGNISYRSDKMDYFTRLGYGFLLAEYRGFGGNAGKPSEEGFYSDARAAMKWLMLDNKIAEYDIVIYGESIGSGAASQMALEYKNTKAVILEAPLANIPDVAVSKMPWLTPVKFMVLDRYVNISKAPFFTQPLLVVQGDRDEVIPYQQGKAVFDAAGSAVKEYVLIPGGHHNDLSVLGLLPAMQAFLAKL